MSKFFFSFNSFFNFAYYIYRSDKAAHIKCETVSSADIYLAFKFDLPVDIARCNSWQGFNLLHKTIALGKE